MEQDTRTIAIFDFDNTLTDRDSLLPFFYQFWGRLRSVYLLIPLFPDGVRYLLGKLSRQEIKERILGQFLTGISSLELESMGATYAQRGLDDILKKQAYQKFLWHKSKGHLCVIVSASPEFYLIPWGRRHGFDRVIASKLKMNSEGNFTGVLEGKNCWGDEKSRRFLLEYPKETWDTLYVYGDSLGDRALLDMAHYPFYRKF